MGRLLAFILGGAALALYGPHLILPADTLAEYRQWWKDTLGDDWFEQIFEYGPGIFAGLALVLIAVRGRD